MDFWKQATQDSYQEIVIEKCTVDNAIIDSQYGVIATDEEKRRHASRCKLLYGLNKQ